MSTNWSPFLQGRSGVDLNHRLSSASRLPTAAADAASSSTRSRLRLQPTARRSARGRPGRFRLISLVSLLARK